MREAELVETRFGHLLESMPDAVLMVGITGHIALANSQAEKLFLYQRDELRGFLV